MGQEQRRANEIMAQKNKELEALSKKLSTSRKSTTRSSPVRFSDVVNFTETTDKLESEDLTNLLNRYLTEMSNIALEHGATMAAAAEALQAIVSRLKE